MYYNFWYNNARGIFKCSRSIRSGVGRKHLQLSWFSCVLSGKRGRSTIVSVPVPNRGAIVLTRSPLSVIIDLVILNIYIGQIGSTKELPS